MIITLFERNSQNSFSIEKISENLIPILSKKDKIKKHIFHYPSRGLINRIKIILEARKNASEVNHITGDVHFASLLLNKANTIITMHDCEKLIGNEYSKIKKIIYRFFWFTLPSIKAKWIVSPSEESKRNLVKYAGIDPMKIRVIPNGTDQEFGLLNLSRKEKNKLLNNPRGKRTVLHVSSNFSHKNTLRLISALEGMDIKFVKVGKLSDYEKNLLDKENIEYIHFENIPKEKLVKIYNSVDCLVYPSLLEGFGIPILEAQKCGCPVITSNVSSMPEIAGNGALLVNPHSIEEIRKAIVLILGNSSVKGSLVKNGLENIKRFKWQHIAQKYHELYQEISNFGGIHRPCN